MTAAVLGATPTGYYNRYMDNSVNFRLIQDGNQVKSSEVEVSNIKMLQLKSDGSYDSEGANIYGNLMSLNDNLWFTFQAESIGLDNSYLFTATATYKGTQTYLTLYVNCEKASSGINLVFTDSDASVVGQYEFDNPVQVTY